MADYLIHFNRNHNPKNGRFDFGDGDGDGIRNDHANHKKETFGKKVDKAVRTYDKLNRHARKRTLETEQYKVNKSDLKAQQAENERVKTASETDKRRDELELQRYKNETKSDIRLRKLEEKKIKSELEAQKKAAKREEESIKRQMNLEKKAARREELQLRAQQKFEKQQIANQKKYERAQNLAEKRARAEYKRRVRQAEAQLRTQERNEAKRKSMRSRAVVAACMGMPLTALTLAGGSTMKTPSTAGFMAKNAVTSLGTFNNPLLAAPLTIASNVGRNSYYKNR